MNNFSGLQTNQVPQAIQQALQQVLQMRKQQGGGIMMDTAMPQLPQSAAPALPQQQQGDPMQGLQAASRLMGYDNGTVFGYGGKDDTSLLPLDLQKGLPTNAAPQDNQFQMPQNMQMLNKIMGYSPNSFFGYSFGGG